MDDRTYSLRDGTEIAPFDSSTPALCFQVFGNARRVAVSSSTATLLEFLKIPRTKAELEAFAASFNFDANVVLSLLEKAPLNHFISDPSLVAQPVRKTKQGNYLYLKYDLFSARAVNALAHCFEWLFSKTLACALVPVILLIHSYFMLSPSYKFPFTLSFTTEQWIAVWLGVYGAIFFHEVGHCAACKRFGSRPGSIGIGLYLIWPVLYADTTESWMLTRRHRAVVDLAGIYFHLVLSAICIIVGQQLNSPVLLVISKSAILSTAINLNPFFRFDGYWLVTDVTGIPNIRRATSEFWQFTMGRFLQGKTSNPTPRLLQISRPLRYCFGAYCISSAVFFADITFHVLRFLPGRFTAIPRNWQAAWHTIVLHPLSFPAAKALIIFCIVAAGFVQTGLMLSRRILRFYKSVRSFLMRIPGMYSRLMRSEP
jgi:putative peptide zinc metalloprotease protein